MFFNNNLSLTSDANLCIYFLSVITKIGFISLPVIDCESLK